MKTIHHVVDIDAAIGLVVDQGGENPAGHPAFQ